MHKLIERTTNLHSFRVSLEDVQRIFDRLLELVKEQGEGEVAALKKPDGKTDDEFAADRVNILETAFRVTVTIGGEDGDALYGDSREVFTSANLPERITEIFMTNVTAYQGFARVRPENRFDLILDFSKPPLLDHKNFVSSPTPNNSHLNVAGSKDSWVASISDIILRTVTKRKNMRSWLHKGFSYDYGLFILGLPFAFYVSWLIHPFVGGALENVHPVVSASFYVYIILTTLFAYRILFGYAKWAFPVAELTDNKDAAPLHRRVFGSIVLALVAQLIWTIVT